MKGASPAETLKSYVSNYTWSHPWTKRSTNYSFPGYPVSLHIPQMWLL